ATQHGVQRATHLVQQLLTLARLDPEATQRPRVLVALNPLLHTVIADHAPLARSEEHTSELQSRVDLVCRLLLEKKKMRKDFLKVGCRLALLPFLISCVIWLNLVASLSRIKERLLVMILVLNCLMFISESVMRLI